MWLAAAALTAIEVRFAAWQEPQPPSLKKLPLDCCSRATGARRGRLGIELAEHRSRNDDARVLRLLPGQSEFAQDGGRVVLLRPAGCGEPGAVLLAEVRAALQQQAYGARIGVVRGHRQHQRRHLANVHGIHLGAGIEQRFRHLGPARRNRQQERGEIAQRDGSVLHGFEFLGARRRSRRRLSPGAVRRPSGCRCPRRTSTGSGRRRPLR